MFFPPSPTSSFGSSSSSSSSSSSTSSSFFGSSPSDCTQTTRASPIEIFPSQQTCAYPSWPRRSALISTPEDEATSFLSDDDLFSLDFSEKAVETIPSYHTIDLVNTVALPGRPEKIRYRAWEGNVTEPGSHQTSGGPRRRKHRSSKKTKSVDQPMSPIIESPE